MCEETTMRPRAIHAYELTNKQLLAWDRLQKGAIFSAWRTSEGAVVYTDSKQPNCYRWGLEGWVEVTE